MSVPNPLETFLEDELLIIRHSGEIPEVTLHGSVYFLAEDPAGPGLILGERELRKLKDMVVERYRQIIFRDLDPANRDKGLYRGLARCIVNWRRAKIFCERENFSLAGTRQEVKKLLKDFLENESLDVRHGKRSSSVNCGYGELLEFCRELDLAPEELPENWGDLCRV